MLTFSQAFLGSSLRFLLSDMMRRTYLGFLAHPKFGEDAPVLSRPGKVRKSERKTGLTRKKKEEEPDPGGSEE